MKLPFIVYVIDTETTGLDSQSNEIIEISILRMNDDSQRTWCIKPQNYESIQPDALRINGHKIEDLKWITEYGKQTYRNIDQVLPEIENFFMEDGEDCNGRILAGQNISYDLGFMKEMWKKESILETFPFGDRPKMIDTLQLALFLDLVKGTREQYYNLGSLVDRYGVKRLKAHAAEQDTIMTTGVLLAQMKIASVK